MLHYSANTPPLKGYVSREEYDALKEEFDNFVYVVSRDLSSPLKTIRENSSRLLDSMTEGLSTHERDHCRMIQKSVGLCQQKLDGLADYSRLHTQAKQFEQVSTDEIISRALEHLDSKITLCSAKVSLPHEGFSLTGDKGQLELLITHLVDNSLKFQPYKQQPEIQIDCFETPQSYQLAVTDNGIGIEAQHRKIVFDLFRRLHWPDEYSGIGVGLTLSRKIAERHQATISIHDSPRDHGCKIIVNFPKTTALLEG